MNEVNNFITDLLDEMADNDAICMKLAGGLVPSYRLNDGTLLVVNSYKPIPSEEIFEDMEALGIKIKVKCDIPYLHIPDGKLGKALRLKTRVNLINGVPTVSFRRLSI